MVNCQWLIVIGKRKVLRVFIFHFSLFTFRSFMCICVHSRHLRNLRSDICHSERSEESPFFSGAGFLTTFGMTRGGVRNDKLMVNCQWLIVIGKRKVLRVFIFHFSLFTFRSFMCICVHSRHLRNLRSDICHSERSEESPFFSGAGFLTTFGMTRGGVRNDKLMVNCQWLIVIGKRKVLRVFIFHFSLFTFRSFMCICVHSRHLRNLRSDNPA
ncbi:hypothetical protein BFO_2187 [Tannerella forsythia 92A2]|uniref:Uncharacterized protein n=1 Tax=Tannerella forsythia (strain ATCC 43037 / JCM 10827 / CCUG 21028 A / KCTC 5666 / FDC 338) TaxID=203275 RepID=G8UIN4_TANFA|nr:hypothetical protein BFO_2187 [Tannerella forsythia 92A2]